MRNSSWLSARATVVFTGSERIEGERSRPRWLREPQSLATGADAGLLSRSFIVAALKSFQFLVHESKHRAEASGQSIAQTMRQRPVVPCLQSYLRGLPQILLKRLRHRSSGRVVEDQDVALGVETE